MSWLVSYHVLGYAKHIHSLHQYSHSHNMLAINHRWHKSTLCHVPGMPWDRDVTTFMSILGNVMRDGLQREEGCQQKMLKKTHLHEYRLVLWQNVSLYDMPSTVTAIMWTNCKFNEVYALVYQNNHNILFSLPSYESSRKLQLYVHHLINYHLKASKCTICNYVCVKCHKVYNIYIIYIIYSYSLSWKYFKQKSIS